MGELEEVLRRLDAIEKAITLLGKLVLEELYGEDDEDDPVLLAKRLDELRGSRLFRDICILGDDEDDDDEPEIRPV